MIILPVIMQLVIWQTAFIKLLVVSAANVLSDFSSIKLVIIK
jgi:hypothetical protein